MQVSILGICSGIGQSRQGLELSPDILRQKVIAEMSDCYSLDVFDSGNIYPQSADKSSLLDLLSTIENKTSDLVNDNRLLLNLGGDHSLAVGTVFGTLKKYPQARVVWIDAHGDINTPASSISGNAHGMPLAALLGLYDTGSKTCRLKQENLLMLGIRELDFFEHEIIKKLNITVITADEINQTPDQALKKIITWLAQSNSVLHVSFDIDAVDPAYAPATGLPVENGLSLDFIVALFNLLSAKANIVALDLVEFNAFKVSSISEVNKSLEVFKLALNEILAQTKLHEK